MTRPLRDYQHDDHMFIGRECWRIVRIADRLMVVEQFPTPDSPGAVRVIDLDRTHWDRYIKTAMEILAKHV